MLVKFSKDSNAQEMVINKIPNQRRTLILSLNIANAMIEVATISKLFNKDALAAVVDFNPNNKQIGAAISSKIIARI